MGKTVLVDCDGVLADFAGRYLESVHRITGRRFTIDDVHQFKIHQSPWFKHLEATDFPTLKRDLDHEITTTPDWTRSLNPLPGAFTALEELRIRGHKVFCVTSPWHSSPFWHYERTVWLCEHMGFSPHEVIHASSKQVVAGDILVDDKTDNLVKWRHGTPLLWDAPWNRGEDSVGLLRVARWDEVVSMAETGHL